MKFKVGDKVKVIKCVVHKNCREIGKISIIKDKYPYELKDSSEVFIEDELELVQEKQFTKSDLKNGDVVTYRNGERAKFINNKFFELKTGREIGNNYDNDLIATVQREYDIVKVERPIQYKTVFERKEEILDETEKRYLRGVIRPFVNEVCSIKKMKSAEQYRIKITTRNGNFLLPHFQKDKMYINMQEEKEYKLVELGL